MGDSTRPVVESDAWCRTTSGDKAITTFTWTIEDFFDRPEKNGEFMISSPFTVSGPSDKKTTWKLKLYPRGDDDDDSDFDLVSLYLENTEEDAREKILFQLSVLNDKHQKDNTVNFTTERVNELYKDGYDGIGVNIICRDDLKLPYLLPNGNLTVFCDLTVFDPRILTGSKYPDEKLVPRDDYGKQMNEQIGKLFDDPKFSDVKITCGVVCFL